VTLPESQIEKIMADCYADPVLFCQTFLHDHFYRPIPWVHRGILSILTGKTRFLLKYGDLDKIVRNFVHQYDEGNTRQIFHVFVDGKEVETDEVKELSESTSLGTGQLGPQIDVKLDLGTFTLILMPRGASKTTIAGLAVPLYKLLYQEDKFTLYVSKADRHSQGQLESVRKELVNNEVIREIFGDLKPKRSEEERWSKEKFETVTGIAMQARGKGSAIRGVNHNNIRPSTIIVDDPQSKDDCKSDIIREDDKKWAFAELTPARARVVGSRGQIHCLATWLHVDCLAAVWSRDPRWTTIKMEVVDADGDWIWPDYMDQEEYDAEKASFQRAGLLGDFYREYHNQEVVEGEQPFPSHFIQYDPNVHEENMVCATYADLATSAKRTADFTAICTVGLSPKGIVGVLDCHVARGMSEEEKVDEYFRQSLQWKSQIHGFESNAYQAVFGETLRGEMFRRGHYFEVEPVPHKTRKVDRILGALRPRYAAGFVRHRVPFPELETQLYDFRRDDSHLHDDGPDAVAAALVLLDPAAGFWAEKDPSEDQFEAIKTDEYGHKDFIWAS
jgi:hypothetical protein